jgi:hypothetical protein
MTCVTIPADKDGEGKKAEEKLKYRASVPEYSICGMSSDTLYSRSLALLELYSHRYKDDPWKTIYRRSTAANCCSCNTQALAQPLQC